MRLALFEPDIPQNLGAMIRLSGALGMELDVIEPCGFPLGDKAIRRAALDYGVCAKVSHHADWAAFEAFRATHLPGSRLLLFTTRSAAAYTDFAFRPDDILLMGRESAGVPEYVHEAADARLYIPLIVGARSINVGTAAAMALGEGLRQTGGFPNPT